MAGGLFYPQVTHQVGGNTAGATANVSSGTYLLAGGNNVTLSQNANSVTISAANLTNSSMSVSDAGTSGTLARLAFTNLNGVTLSLSTGGGGSHTIVGSHNALTSQSNQAFSAAGGSSAFQTLQFRNANGLSFSNSNGSVEASYTVPSQTNQTLGIYVTAQSTGQSSSSTFDARSLSLIPDGILSAGWSNGSLRISATQSNQAFSAAGGASAFQTLGFSDNAYGSWTNTQGSIALTEMRASFYAESNTTQGTSGTQNLDAVTFAGAGIASVGVTNGSVLISVPAGGGGGDGGVFAGVSDIGNSAGSTGTVSTGNLVLVGSNNITLSQSTAGAGSHATVSIFGPAPVTLSMYNEFKEAVLVAGQQGQGSLHLQPWYFPFLHHDRVVMPVLFSNATNTTGSMTVTFAVGLYTSNASTLSLAASSSWTTGVSASGTANSTLNSGPRIVSFGWTNTVTEGRYWVGVVSSTTSGGANVTLSQWLISRANSNFSGYLGSATSATVQSSLGMGVYTAATSAMPASIAFSQINGSQSIAQRAPSIVFQSRTA